MTAWKCTLTSKRFLDMLFGESTRSGPSNTASPRASATPGARADGEFASVAKSNAISLIGVTLADDDREPIEGALELWRSYFHNPPPLL